MFYMLQTWGLCTNSVKWTNEGWTLQLCGISPSFTWKPNKVMWSSTFQSCTLQTWRTDFKSKKSLLLPFCQDNPAGIPKAFWIFWEMWAIKKCPRDPSFLGDIYDGRVWRNFKSAEGKPFFDAPNTFGCMWNLDWFQPYKDSVYSVGVIYLSFLNLPPQERNKEENVAVVGIIPGPQEPSRNVNSFLDPLVEELLDFWDDVWLDCPSTGPRFCRLAVLCVTCDIPASRKLCGFLGFSARKGCNKCKKEFPRSSFGEKQDFSGFDRDSWDLHTNIDHREQVWRVHNSVTSKKGREKKESVNGVWFSSLIHLPYFDFIACVVIDPMHNLMLGTTKKMLKIWKELNLLDEQDFKVLQKRINKLKVPSSIGRIPSKIASGFKGFTADQFKNWAVVFSSFALKGILPDRHLQC